MKFLEEQIENKMSKRMDDEDEDEYGYHPVLRMYNKPKQINEVDAYLDGPIKAPAEYRNLLHYMRVMEPEDKLRIWLNTPGGHFDTALDIIESMNKSEGDIQVIVTGRAYSAGSLIALSAPKLNVSDNATFMCHHASYGYGGKAGDVKSFVKFTDKQIEDMARKTYKHFMSEEEIGLMLEGKDYWFDNQETLKRLQNRQNILDKLAADQQKAEAKANKRAKQSNT